MKKMQQNCGKKIKVKQTSSSYELSTKEVYDCVLQIYLTFLMMVSLNVKVKFNIYKGTPNLYYLTFTLFKLYQFTAVSHSNGK